MNLKQKLYSLKHELKATTEKMTTAALADDFDPESESYKGLVSESDSLTAKIAAVEAQIERDKAFSGADDEGEGAEGGLQKGMRGAAGGEAVYSVGLLKGLKHESVKSFAADIRKSMTEGTAAEGGYTVPEDVVTRIYELVEAKENMLPYITNTPVTTNKGSRPYKKRAQLKGFKTVAEAAKYGATSQPEFAQMQYQIAKRGGYLPVTLELLEDSDESIAAIVIDWLADEYRVTINNNIIEKAESVAAKPIASLDDLLEILTVGLGSALRGMSTVHINDSGLLWLGKLKDNNGRPLLQADPTQPTRMLLGVGPVTVPVKPWDNLTLPNGKNGEIPMIIGCLKEGIERFDRKQLTITKLDQATLGNLNLAEQDMVAFKASCRDDYQIRDDKAWIFGQIIPAAAPSAPAQDAAGNTDDAEG